MHEDLNRVAILLEDLVQPPTAGIPVVQVPLPGPHIDGSFVDLGDVVVRRVRAVRDGHASTLGVRYGAQDRLRCQGRCCWTECRVRLAERQGEMTAQIVRAALGDPELALRPDKQQVALTVIGRHMREMGVLPKRSRSRPLCRSLYPRETRGWQIDTVPE